jgi:acyl homoserine lactone synthase
LRFTVSYLPRFLRREINVNQISLGSLRDTAFTRTYAPQMFELRYRVFHERMQWNVRCHGQWEIDEFDNDRTVYIVAHNEEANVRGSWRLLPTTVPYMLSDVFPQLLDGKPVPRAPKVWEISRFAVDTEYAAASSTFGFGDVAKEMVRSTIQYAYDEGITQYVMVVSVAVERLLRNMGLILHRFGPPQRIGKVLSVACWLDIDAHTCHAILGHPLPIALQEAA